MNTSHELIKKVRNGNAVKRWHTRRMLTNDTVGEHTANVLAIVLAINPNPTLELIKAAVIHDTAEQWTGDIPATAKWMSPKLKSACDELEVKMLLANGFEIPTLTSFEQLVLKWADMLDLLYRCLDEIRLGNRSMVAVFKNGVNYLENYEPNYKGKALLNELIEEFKYV